MIKRCPRCGCPSFKTKQVIWEDVIVDGNGVVNVEISESKGFTGNYTCEKCGAEYQSLSELWNDKSPYVGITHYLDYDEKNECSTEAFNC